MKNLTPEINDELQHHRPDEKYRKSTAKTDRVKDITPEINENNRQHHRHYEIYFGSTGTIN